MARTSSAADGAARNHFHGGLGWIDRDGISRVSGSRPRTGSGSNVADRAYFTSVISTGKPYISEGLVTRGRPAPGRDHGCARRATRAAGSAACSPGRWSCASPATSQRAIDLGFGALVLIDRAGQQLTLASFAQAREHGACSRRIRKGDGVLGDTTGLNGGGGRVVAYANSIAAAAGRSRSTARARRSSPPRRGASCSSWSRSWSPPRSCSRSSAGRSRAHGARSPPSASRCAAGTSWRSRSARPSAAADVAAALGSSLATAFPRARVIVALQDDEAGRFGSGRSAAASRARRPAHARDRPRSRGSAIRLRLAASASRSREAVGTVVAPLDGDARCRRPGSVYALPMRLPDAAARSGR